MLQWIKKHVSIIIPSLVLGFFLIFVYACEPKVPSLNGTPRKVNREELQFELNTIIELAELRMLDLDKQDRLRGIILQNALVIIEGQPFNPIGIITGFAALYGLTQGGRNITQVVKDTRNKRKVNNG